MMYIPENIHDKSEPLSAKDRLYIESHPQMGIELIEPLAFLKKAKPIIKHHHERHDGKGYPDGLAGDEIPLGSQILAVADSFVAMRYSHPYKKSFGLEQAVYEIKKNSGSQFNPRVVDALLKTLNEIESYEENNNS